MQASMRVAVCLLATWFLNQPAQGESFDYVIVGGGTAGLVVANRLSAQSTVSVAVVEVGGDQRNNPNVTNVNKFIAAFNTSIDWQYPSVPQKYAANRVFDYHQGKAIGGTSTINGMTYIRAQKAEIDAWEQMGNPGWNWDTMFPYYKKAEHYDPPTSAQVAAGASYDPQYHGTTGPVHVGYPFSLQNGSLEGTIQQSWEALHQPFNHDVNSGNVSGFDVWPRTCVRDLNLRADAAESYYWPVSNRPNLKMYRGTVTKVLMTSGCKATGIEFILANGTTQTLGANKEVILSAGSFRTPAILELSGIGNPSILSKFGIKTNVALPTVGENLQDQPSTTVAYVGNVNITGFAPYATFPTADQFFGPNASAIEQVSSHSLASWAGNVSAANNYAVSADALERLFRIQHDLIFKQNVPSAEILTTALANTLLCAAWTLLPFSRGSVHIGSANPVQPPLIDPKFFLIDYDMKVDVALSRLSRKFWSTPPAKGLVVSAAAPSDSVVPPNATDKQWESFITGAFAPNYHPLGTAAMMSKDLGGVVDSSLRVYGTSNLRVVDASVIPMQMSGHVTATLYALAERAADIIISGK